MPIEAAAPFLFPCARASARGVVDQLLFLTYDGRPLLLISGRPAAFPAACNIRSATLHVHTLIRMLQTTSYVSSRSHNAYVSSRSQLRIDDSARPPFEHTHTHTNTHTCIHDPAAGNRTLTSEHGHTHQHALADVVCGTHTHTHNSISVATRCQATTCAFCLRALAPATSTTASSPSSLRRVPSSWCACPPSPPSVSARLCRCSLACCCCGGRLVGR